VSAVSSRNGFLRERVVVCRRRVEMINPAKGRRLRALLEKVRFG
jgi:hypothetical protein